VRSIGGTSLGSYPVGTRARVIVALIPCCLSIFIATLYLQVMAGPSSPCPPFTDAVMYLAAGERLNAGRDLYALHPGDRPVVILPEITTAPLLSPPPIAVLWRPIAVLPFGFALWIAACWVALLGTTFQLVLRAGLPGAVLASLLSPAIGEQLAAGNVAGFFPLLMVLAWRLRARPVAGAIVGLMASLKLTPGALGGWLVGTRRWSGVAAAVVAVGLLFVVSLIGSSPAAFVDYLRVATTAGPSTASLSGLTGLGWLSSCVLVAGTLLAIGLGRWPRAAFIIAVVTSVLGTPSLYLSGWVAVLATLAPFTDRTSAHAKVIGHEG